MSVIRVFAHEYCASKDHRFLLMVEIEGEVGKWAVSDIHDLKEESIVDGALYEVTYCPDSKRKDIPHYFRVDINTREIEVVDAEMVEGFNKL